MSGHTLDIYNTGVSGRLTVQVTIDHSILNGRTFQNTLYALLSACALPVEHPQYEVFQSAFEVIMAAAERSHPWNNRAIPPSEGYTP